MSSRSCRLGVVVHSLCLTPGSSSLRAAPLHGVFVSITPGDPSLWVGVIFVRKGMRPLPAMSVGKIEEGVEW